MTGATRSIQRAWEIDRSHGTPGAPWESYGWLLDVAHRTGHDEVSILVSNYRVFKRLGPALGTAEASALFDPPHQYVFGGVVVQGVPWRGGWQVRGPVLVVGGDAVRLRAVEAAGAPAVAVVTDDPLALARWRRTHVPRTLAATRPGLDTSTS